MKTKKKNTSVQKIKSAKKRAVKPKKTVKKTTKATKKTKVKQNPLHRINGQEVVIKIEY